MRRTQGTIHTAEPDWNPWLEFFLRSLQRQKQRLEKKMEREWIMLAAMPELSVLILELAREHGRATVAEAAKVSGARRARRNKAPSEPIRGRFFAIPFYSGTRHELETSLLSLFLKTCANSEMLY